MKPATPGRILSDPVLFLAFGFGAGLAPVAPGTAGTLVAVVLERGLRTLPWAPRLGVTLGVVALGFWLCGEAARRLGVHDHPGIVWDEFAGYLLLMLAAPAGWRWATAGFLLFRLFDVWKPWPIRDLDHGMTGGTGIMLDDLVAGMYAAAILVAARMMIEQ